MEGFKTKPIRAKLDTVGVQYDKQDRTIALLEKLVNKENLSSQPQKLVGLRTVQYLRSKTKGHVGGRYAKQLAMDAIREHESFGNHFQHVCQLVFEDLEAIQQQFDDLSSIE